MDWFCGQARMPGEGSPSNLGVEIVQAMREHDGVVAALANPEDLPKETAALVRRNRLDACSTREQGSLNFSGR